MKRYQWIRLAIFLISFAIFLTLPLHQYRMREYIGGKIIVLDVVTAACDKDSDCLDFVCVAPTVPAPEGATDLGQGFVFFDLSGKTARIAGVADERRAVPENSPFIAVRDLKLTPDGKSYQLPLRFHYFAENPAHAANLRMQLNKVKQIQIAVEIFPDGKCQVNEVILP